MIDPNGINGPADFAVGVLQGLGAPISDANVQALSVWERAEGGNWQNTASYNPLNTTLREPGSRPYQPGASVQAYPDWATGLRASIDTLTEPQYGAVVADLRRSAPAAQTLADVAASPWAEGHYAAGGQQGGSLFALLGSGPAAPSAQPATLTRGLLPNPFGGVGGDIVKAVRSVVIEGFFLLLGVGLIGLGAARFAQPVTKPAVQAAGAAAVLA